LLIKAIFEFVKISLIKMHLHIEKIFFFVHENRKDCLNVTLASA